MISGDKVIYVGPKENEDQWQDASCIYPKKYETVTLKKRGLCDRSWVLEEYPCAKDGGQQSCPEEHLRPRGK